MCRLHVWNVVACMAYRRYHQSKTVTNPNRVDIYILYILLYIKLIYIIIIRIFDIDIFIIYKLIKIILIYLIIHIIIELIYIIYIYIILYNMNICEYNIISLLYNHYHNIIELQPEASNRKNI